MYQSKIYFIPTELFEQFAVPYASVYKKTVEVYIDKQAPENQIKGTFTPMLHILEGGG